MGSQYDDVEYPFYDADGQYSGAKFIQSNSGSSSGSDQGSSESSSIPSGVRKIKGSLIFSSNKNLVVLKKKEFKMKRVACPTNNRFMLNILIPITKTESQ